VSSWVYHKQAGQVGKQAGGRKGREVTHFLVLTERGDPGLQAIRYEITYAAAYLVLVEETLGSCSCSASVFRNSGSISRTWDWG